MKLLSKTIFVIAIFLVVLYLFTALTTLGAEDLDGMLLIDLNKETAEYTESHDFSGSVRTTVTVTARVDENICNYCLANYNSNQCLDACGVK
jgi:hypothetical protein